MKPPLSDEQRQALNQEPEGIEVEDAQTQKVYFLTDAELHRRAMDALNRQEDHAAIQAGIDDMEAGRVEPYETVSSRLRTHLKEKFGLPLGEA
jgi:predicted transcriptional regulator